MNLLKAILEAQGGGAVRQVASQHGIGETEAAQAIAQLLPALAGGLKRNVASAGGLESLLGALASGQHARYVENPAMLGQANTISDGNAILGHILGSKEVSRQVAGRAAASTGLDVGVLKQMLPVVATLAMGALSKQQQGASPLGALGAAAGGRQPAGNALGMLTQFLDVDGDGSVANELLGMAKKLF